MKKLLLASCSLAVISYTGQAFAAAEVISEDTTIGEYTVKADGISQTGGTLTLNNSLLVNADSEFTGGNIVADGIQNDTRRNGIDDNPGISNLTFGEDFGTADISNGGGIVSRGVVTIDGGTFNVRGNNDKISDKWGTFGQGSIIDGEGGIVMNGGEVNVSEGAQLVSGHSGAGDKVMDIKAGVINVNNGLIRASSDNEESASNYGAIKFGNNGLSGEEFKAATVNINGGTLASRATTIDKGARLNVNGGTLDLVGDIQWDGDDKPEATDKVGTLTLNATDDDTASGTLAIASGAVVNANKVAISNQGVIELSGTLNGNISSSGSGKDTVGDIDVLAGSAKIKGNVDKQNVYLKANKNLGDLVEGEVSNIYELMLENGAQVNADAIAYEADKAKANGFNTVDSLVIGSSGTVAGEVFNLSQDFTATTKTKVNKGATLSLGKSNLTSGLVTLKDGSSLQTVVGASSDGKAAGAVGKITGNVALNGSVNLLPVVENGAIDSDYQFIAGTVSAADAEKDKFVISGTNALYDVTLADTNDTLTVAKKSAAETQKVLEAAGGSANDVGVINAWTQSSEGITGQGAEIQDKLTVLAQTNPAEMVKATKALAPDAAPSVTSSAAGIVTNAMNVIGNRMSAGLATSGIVTGKSSGDARLKNGAWAQYLYNKGKYDVTDGFDAKTNGFAGGFDHKFQDFTVGIGYSYSATDIDSVGRTTDADTHTVFTYGEYKPSKWFLNGIASYSFADYDEHKNVAGTGVEGKYDVNTFGAQIMGGYDMGWFTPMAGVRYLYIDQDGYTDSAGQNIAGSSSDIFTGVVGAKAAKSFAMGKGMSLTPEVRVAATYDFARADSSSTVSLANGSSYTVNGDKLDRFGVEVGAGVSMDIDNFVLSARYEGKFKKDYHDNTGLLEARYNF